MNDGWRGRFNRRQDRRATSRHLQQARDAGRVPISREAIAFASLTAVVLVLAYQWQAAVRDLLAPLKLFLTHADGSGRAGLGIVVWGVLAAIAPVLMAAAVGAAAAVLLQTNFLLHGGSLQPKVSRINPVAGFKRIFGWHGLEELLKSLAKLGIFGIAI